MSDEAAAKIMKRVSRQFQHNRLTLFDELNVTQTRKHIKKLYADVYKIIKKEYAKILNPIYEEIYDEALALGFVGDLRDLDEGFIEEFFDEYNPVTKYVFKNEMSRKESRLFEALVASTAEKVQSYRTAENLLKRQIQQYAVDLEDAIAKTVYKEVKVKKVQWVAEQDHKTCGVCSELDGQIFALKDAPPKQHYHCRCYLIPVAE